MIYFLQSGNRKKLKVLPKRNVTFPSHRCMRGSVLWVHLNKEAVKSFQVPGCFCLLAYSLPPWPFCTIPTDSVSLTVRHCGQGCSDFHMRKSDYESEYVLYKGQFTITVLTSEPRYVGQQLFINCPGLSKSILSHESNGVSQAERKMYFQHSLFSANLPGLGFRFRNVFRSLTLCFLGQSVSGEAPSPV